MDFGPEDSSVIGVESHDPDSEPPSKRRLFGRIELGREGRDRARLNPRLFRLDPNARTTAFDSVQHARLEALVMNLESR